MDGQPRRGSAMAGLLAAPALIAAALVVYLVSDRLVVIGPFDRAKIGWAVVVPLLALAPGAAALAGRSAGTRPAALSALAVAVVSGVGVAVWLAVATTYMDCQPVGDPFVVLPRTLATGLGAGVAFGSAAAAAWRVAGRGDRRARVAAVALGAGVWLALATLALFVWVASFPISSCVPVATP